MNNFLDGVDKAKLAGAVELIKRTIGPAESMKIENAAKSEADAEKLLSGLGDREKAAILKVMNDPQMLSLVLTSPKARDGIKKFLNER